MFNLIASVRTLYKDYFNHTAARFGLLFSFLLSFSLTAQNTINGPGGVGGTINTDDLVLWLDSRDIDGDGIYTNNPGNGDISFWADKSGRNNSQVQGTPAARPEYQTAAFGNRGGVDFDVSGTADVLELNTNGFPSSGGARTVLAVSQYDLNASNFRFFFGYGEGASGKSFILGKNNNNNHIGSNFSTANLESDPVIDSRTAAVVSLTHAGVNNDASGLTYRLGGGRARSGNTGVGTNIQGAFVGAHPNASGNAVEHWDGDVGEIILYGRELEDVERIIVENYLAAKYGLALVNNDFYTQDNAGLNYDFHVAGIGRDAGGNTHLDSRGTGSVRMQIGSITVNDSYLFWGTNTEISEFISPDVQATETFRLNNIWRVNERNTVDTVNVTIDLSQYGGITPADVVMYRHTTTTLSAGTRLTPTSTTATTATFRINFNNDDYFTFAYSSTRPITTINGPGGIGGTINTDNLVLWLDGRDIDGDGATNDNPADGASVQTWEDKSGRNNDATQGTPANRATYNSTAAPLARGSLTFDGSNDTYTFGSTDIPTGTNPRSFITLIEDNNSSDFAFALGYGATRAAGGVGQEFNMGILSTAASQNYGFDRVGGAMNSGVNEDNNGIIMLATRTGSNYELFHSRTAGRVATHTDATNTGGTNFTIGARPDGLGTLWTGEIAEVIGYNKVLNEAERIIIFNYLAAKYSMTLPAANNIYTMDNTGNGDFDFHVAGIGRDGNNNIVFRARGTSIITIQAQSVPAANRYFFWGSEATELNFNERIDVPNGYESRTPRWRVSESGGNLGNLTITIDATSLGVNINQIVLAVDNDGTFENGATIVPNPTIRGNNITYYNVDLADGEYFTILFGSVGSVNGPGGIGGTINTDNLVLWLDARDIDGDGLTNDNPADGASVQTWEDKSGRNNDATQGTPANRATYNSTAAPLARGSFTFDGSNDTYTFGSTDIPTGTNPRSFITLIEDNNSSDFAFALGYGATRAAGGVGQEFNMGILNTASSQNYGFDRVGGAMNSGVNEDNNGIIMLATRTGSNYELFHSRTAGRAATHTDATNTGGTNFTIGARPDGSGTLWTGEIAEVIGYNKVLNEAERIIIFNYLAAKYSMTLPAANDFYTQDNPGNGDFDFHVAGIGRDTGGNTHLDSRGTGLVRMQIASITTPDSYLFWGTDSEVADFGSRDVRGTERFRLSNVWRVSERNTVGAVDVTFEFKGYSNLTAANIVMYRHTATTFSGAARLTPSSSTSTTVTFRVNFNDGDYFTFAHNVAPPNNNQVNGPGGVGGRVNNDHLVLWLDAHDIDGDGRYDDNPADGDAISLWNDKSGRNNSLSQSNAGMRPNYRAAAFDSRGGINFETTGTEDRFSLNTNGFPSGGGARTILATADAETTPAGSFRFFFGYGRGNSGQSFMLGHNNGGNFIGSNFSTADLTSNPTTLALTNSVVSLTHAGGNNVADGLTFRVAGGAATTGNTGVGTDIQGAFVGAHPNNGSPAVAQEFWDGDVGESPSTTAPSQMSSASSSPTISL